MSTTLSRPTLEPARTPLGRGSITLMLRTTLSSIFSFEMLVVLYIYSNVFQVLLPKLPIDSTIIFFVLSVGFGGLIMLREGVYLRGLYLVMAYLPYLFWGFLSIAWTPSTTQSTVMMSAAQEFVIQRFWPESRYPPGTGVAVVCIAAADRSVLAAGSLVAKDPTISPRIRRGRYSPRMRAGAFCSVPPTSSA